MGYRKIDLFSPLAQDDSTLRQLVGELVQENTRVGSIHALFALKKSHFLAHFFSFQISHNLYIG
jgi:hypothetical protein